MSQDIISDCLNQIMNAKRARKKKVVVKRHSKLLIEVLGMMKKNGYLDHKINGREAEIEMTEKLNECRTIKPRYNVKTPEIDTYVRRFLPARDFGIIIVSTNKGLMTHEEALKKNLGGSLIAHIF